MSFLDKINALLDPKLKETFERKEYDPSKDRAWVVARLETTKTQFGSTETTRGGGAKWWKLSNGVVAFSPVRADRQPLVINGQTTNFIPAERFAEFVDHVIAAVNGGEFDKELKADSTAGKTVKISSSLARKTTSDRVRVRQDGSEVGKGWSEERRAKYAATVAARNAGKQS